MNKLKFLMSALLAVVALSAFAAPKKEKGDAEEATRVYLYGVALNFNDSVVYMTDLQYLDSVVISKDGSLNNYSAYSHQLKHYLEAALGDENQTCAVIYSPKKKKVEKLMELLHIVLLLLYLFLVHLIN